MKYFYSAILILHIWLLPKMLQAQQIIVFDKSDIQPIAGADVLVKSEINQQRYVTNNKGAVTLSAAPNDSVFIKFIGYQTFKGTLAQITSNKNKVYLIEDVFLLDEVVLSANRREEKRDNQPTRIEVVNQKQITFNNPQTSAELLQQTGKVFIQQSQMGGGSPVIRGFEANKVLMVVDGVRLNNAIYRGGHLQNAITIDPNILDRAEIVFGPGSVMYGSDALGGVVHFYTRKPQLSTEPGKVYTKTNAFVRYATANQEKSAHLNFNLGFNKVAILVGATYKDFGDLRAGGSRNPLHGDFGKRNFYVKRVDGKDSAFENTDPNLQVGSGYKQYDFFGKILFAPSQNWNIILNHQLSNSTDIPRYDRLTEVRNGKPRFAEWYYGPQFRMLNSLQNIFYAENIAFNRLTVTAAHQLIQESRIDRPFNGMETRHRIENVNVFSLNADVQKTLSAKNELQYGAEILYNTVNSTAFTRNIETGATGPLDTRYPDGGSNMTTIAGYITHTWKILPNFIFSQGIRASSISLNAKFDDTTFFNFPVKEVSQQNSAVNGNLGLVFKPDSSWKISAVASSGFRAANVDDLAKVFESTPGNIIIPNPNLKPEYTYNAELSIAKNFGSVFKAEATGFYTWFTDAIVTRPFQYNGQDSIMYQGKRSRVQANVNAQNAFLYGAQGEIALQANEAVSLLSSLTYTYGRVKNDNSPLDHIPPMFGQTTLRMEVSRFKGEFFVRYNDWKLLKDYSTSGEDNLQYALPQGMPGWYTLNVRTDYQVTNFLKLQAGIENILDKHYRQFASGISAPGRNFYVALRGSF